MEGKESLFLIANSYCEALQFELPQTTGKWYKILESASKMPFEIEMMTNATITVPAYSICLLKEE